MDQAADLTHQLGEIHFLRDETSLARVGEKLLGQVGGLLARSHHGFYQRMIRVVGRQVFEREAWIAEDAYEQVIEIMRYSARNQSNTFELLYMLELFCRTLLFRDVTQDSRATAYLSIDVSQGGDRQM